MGDDVKPQGFALLAVVLFFTTVAVLSLIQAPVRLAKSPDELRAVRVAFDYLQRQPRYRYATGRVPGVSNKWGSWVVTFPPACSVTGAAGPRVSVTPAFKVTEKVRVSDGICVDDTPWWQRPETRR